MATQTVNLTPPPIVSNGVPSNSTQQVLADSTRAAQDAAKAIGGSFQENTGFTPGTNYTGVPLGKISPVVDASILGKTQPLNIAAPQTKTAAEGLLTTASSLSDATITQQAQEAAASLVDQNNKASLQTSKNTLQKRILDLMGQPGKEALTDTLYSAPGGVDDTKKELNDITAQINAKTLAARRQVEKIQDTGGGLTSGQDVEIDRIQKASAREIADLSIIQMAKQNNYTAAQEIADRKVAVETENDQHQLDALNVLYQDNKDQLSKQEDEQFQATIAERSRLLQDKKDELKTLQDTKLDMIKSASAQGAPSSVLIGIQQASSPEAAISAAGQYAGDILDRQYKKAQIDKIYSDLSGAGSLLTPADVQTTSFGVPYVDLSAYTGKDKQTAVQQAQRAGIPALSSAADVTAAQSAEGALNMVNTIETEFASLAPSDAGQKLPFKLVQDPLNKLLATPYGNKLGAFQANRDSLFRTIGVLAGSHPRINQQELELAQKSFPTLSVLSTDTRDQGQAKIDLTRQHLFNAIAPIYNLTPEQLTTLYTQSKGPSVQATSGDTLSGLHYQVLP